MNRRKAGALIFNQTKDKILLLYRGRERDWSFPKGSIEEGEDAETAMLREVREETGLMLSQIRPLPAMHYVTAAGDEVVLFMFSGCVREEDALHAERAGDELMWFSLQDALERLSHQNLKEYFLSLALL